VRIRSRGAFFLLRKLAIVLLAATPLAAQALGLGRFMLHSGLDEPLNAQIELLSPTTGEIKTLKTSLASREDFDIAGVERAPHLFDIKYAVSQSPNGKYFLKLTSDQPIREPFLHFLIQVEWSGGRLIREYSALLDPPQWASGKPAEIETPQLLTGEGPSSVPTAAEAETPMPVETLPPIGTEPEQAKVAVAEAAPSTAEPEPAAPATPGEPPAPVGAETVPAAEAAAPPAVTEPTKAAETKPSVIPTPQAEAEPPAEVATMPAEPTPVTEPAAVPAPMPEASPAMAGPSEYGPVRKGETLSQIAERVVTDKSVSPQQVMIAMLRANPAAFINNNVNHLMAGKILSVPDRETIAAVSRDEATREFRAQYDAWQEYKLKLAGSSRALTVAESEPPPVKKDETKPAPPTKSEKATKKQASARAEPTDLLRIVRANLEKEIAEDTAKTPGVETRKDAAKEQGKLTERVATLEEALESQQMQNKEMRERAGKLQDQVKNTERLIELENKDLAKAQKQAAEKAAAEKAAAEKAAAEKAAAEKAAAEKAAAEKAAGQKPAPVQKPAAATARKPTPPPPPPQEDFLSGLLAGILDNPVTLALLGGVAALLAGLGGFYVYRRRRASREFSESILSGSSISADASIMDTSGQAAASDTSFLSDFSQGGMGNIHTDEVDPIAEAEVYLAYGRDEQAEEILKDAIVKDPVRQELKGKLLEIYFQRHDVSAFETLAEELYAQLEGKGGKVWDKAEEMGRKLSPSNPMFRGGKPATGAATAPAAATTMLVSEPSTSAEPTLLDESPVQVQEPTSGLDLAGSDMSLDFESPSTKPPESEALDMTLDFDAGTAAPTTEAEGVGAGGGDFDLDLGLGESGGEEASNSIDFSLPSSPEPESSGGLDFSTSSENGGLDFTSSFETQTESGLDFTPEGTGDSTLEFEKVAEPPASEAGSDTALPGWDETATKLDLAKAYIDMGDSEGARSILDEVMAEGNDQQKQQARDLASQIAA